MTTAEKQSPKQKTVGDLRKTLLKHSCYCAVQLIHALFNDGFERLTVQTLLPHAATVNPPTIRTELHARLDELGHEICVTIKFATHFIFTAIIFLTLAIIAMGVERFLEYSHTAGYASHALTICLTGGKYLIIGFDYAWLVCRLWDNIRLSRSSKGVQ